MVRFDVVHWTGSWAARGAALSDVAAHTKQKSNMTPNQPDAVNPAMALWLTIEDQWRRVTDLGRSLRHEVAGTTAERGEPDSALPFAAGIPGKQALDGRS